jgi:hypothetical protein
MAFHNLLVLRPTIDEALAEFQRITSFMPRRWAVTANAIIRALLTINEALRAAARSGTEPQHPDAKTQLENYLCLEIVKAWQRRRSVVGELSQPLACFVDGDLAMLDRQITVTPGGNEGCAKDARCGAAAELRKRSKEVQALVDALRPSKEEAGEKRETTGRRKALKEILAKPAADFDKRRCRHIGDAYYCVMAPEGFEILTTNVADFAPMAGALKKTVRQP